MFIRSKLDCRCSTWTIGGLRILNMQFHHFTENLGFIPSHGTDAYTNLLLYSKLFLTLNKQKDTARLQRNLEALKSPRCRKSPFAIFSVSARMLTGQGAALSAWLGTAGRPPQVLLICPCYSGLTQRIPAGILFFFWILVNLGGDFLSLIHQKAP